MDAVAEVLSELPSHARLLRIGLDDTYCSLWELILADGSGLDANGIRKAYFGGNRMKWLLFTCTDPMAIQFLVPHVKYLSEHGFSVELACSEVGGRLQELRTVLSASLLSILCAWFGIRSCSLIEKA